MMEEAYRIKGPVYIRLGNNREEYYKEEDEFSIGKPKVIKEGKDVTVMVTGTIINEVMKAAELLKNDGIDVRVVSVHTLKPIDAQTVRELLEKTERLITVEEHNTIGGLYSGIAEIMADQNMRVPSLKIGLNDVFAEGYGAIEYVRSANGIGAREIYNKIEVFLNDKS